MTFLNKISGAPTGRLYTRNFLTKPKRVYSILRMLFTKFTPSGRGDMSSMQIRHSWQSFITSPPHKMLNFIWNPELPKTPPKLLLVFQIGATCIRNRITGYNHFICTTSSEHTRRSVSPGFAYTLVNNEFR